MDDTDGGDSTEPAPAAAAEPALSTRILVPVGTSRTMRNTVDYAVEEALDAAAASGHRAVVHFVYPIGRRSIETGDRHSADRIDSFLDRVAVWAREDAALDEAHLEEADLEEEGPELEEASAEGDGESVPIDIETAVIGEDRYLFSPSDFAEALTRYARAHDLDRVVVDPEFRPGGQAPMLQPLTFELSRSDLTVEEAPVERETRRRPIVGRSGAVRSLLVFGACFAFYLVIGGTASSFDLVTGAISAGIVSLLSANVALKGRPDLRRLIPQIARLALFVPYLLWEIVKANVQMAAVILHPSLPIDPAMQPVRAWVWGDLPVTTLANSITLTPGTLTVDVTRQEFQVHTLTRTARAGLLAGSLERAVRFVFYGRVAMSVPTPAERMDLAEGEP